MKIFPFMLCGFDFIKIPRIILWWKKSERNEVFLFHALSLMNLWFDDGNYVGTLLHKAT